MDEPYFEEVLMRRGEWVSAHEWLKEYNEMETRELDKRRFFMWLMREHNAGNEGDPLQSNYQYLTHPTYRTLRRERNYE